MAKANPLKKITAEAKRIRKRKPKTTWKSAVKQAGAKYRSGKIRAPKRKKVAAVGRVRKKAAKRKKTSSQKRKRPVTAVTVRKTSTTVRARRVGRSAPVKRHRMAGSGGRDKTMKTLLTVGLLAGAAFLIWKAMKPTQPQLPPGTPPLVQSANPVRNTQSSQIVQYAIAAGLTIDAITRLIQNLNVQRDTDVSEIYDELDRGGELPATLYA